MNGYVTTLAATCGVGLVYAFDAAYGNQLSKTYVKTHGGGIGYNVAGFVSTPRSKRVYEWLSENYDIVFQSPVKKNRRSGRKFFFIVFKDKE